MFATVRHRPARTEGALSRETARRMVFGLVTAAAAKTRRRLEGENQLPKLVQGVTFASGVEVTDASMACRLATALPEFRHSSAGNANMRSVWICSRNDPIGMAVIVAAAGVFGTGSE